MKKSLDVGKSACTEESGWRTWICEDVSDIYMRAGRTASPDALLALSVHPIPRVRRRVAENGHCPSFVLLVMARDEDAEVRIAVSENSNTPYSALVQLSRDECADVRFAMAENPNVPLSILESLFEDENPFVAQRARRTVNRLGGRETLLAFPLCSRQLESGDDAASDGYLSEGSMGVA